jgi:hypothetical protein
MKTDEKRKVRSCSMTVRLERRRTRRRTRRRR